MLQGSPDEPKFIEIFGENMLYVLVVFMVAHEYQAQIFVFVNSIKFVIAEIVEVFG